MSARTKSGVVAAGAYAERENVEGFSCFACDRKAEGTVGDIWVCGEHGSVLGAAPAEKKKRGNPRKQSETCARRPPRLICKNQRRGASHFVRITEAARSLLLEGEREGMVAVRRLADGSLTVEPFGLTDVVAIGRVQDYGGSTSPRISFSFPVPVPVGEYELKWDDARGRAVLSPVPG